MKETPMFNKIFKNKVIFHNFCKILVILFVIILTVTLFVYRQSKQVIENEFVEANLNVANQNAQNTEEVISQTKRLAAYLTVDTMVQIFFASDAPEQIFDKFYEQILQKIRAYSYGISYIDSVYLYSPFTKDVISTRNGLSSNTAIPQVVSLEDFEDGGWYSSLETDNTGNYMKLLTRAVADRYPYVLSILSHSRVNGTEGVVVININLKELYSMLTTVKNHTQQFFMLDENGRVIMKEQKSALYETAGEIGMLSSFRPGEPVYRCIVNDTNTPYAFAQVKSDEYGFYYISCAELTEYTAKVNHTQGIALAFAIFFILVGAIFAVLLSFHSFKPIQEIMDLLDDPVSWHDRMEKSPEEIRKIADRIISNIQTNASLREELNHKLNLLDQTKMQALQAQINPHFLFNTLNMISLTAATEMGETHPAACMPVQLAEILRYSLEAAELVSVNTEIYYANLYVSILMQRYVGMFQTRIEAGPEVSDAKIPRLSLQPLIENAVYHGLTAREEETGGLLGITVRKENYCYEDSAVPSICICITDNGCGMDADTLADLRADLEIHDTLATAHIGIRNVAMRLNLLFHENYRITVDSSEGIGTKLTIIIPYM